MDFSRGGHARSWKKFREAKPWGNLRWDCCLQPAQDGTLQFEATAGIGNVKHLLQPLGSAGSANGKKVFICALKYILKMKKLFDLKEKSQQKKTRTLW